MTALQRETGLALISRVGRGIEPTAAGRALALEIDGVLSRLGEVESVVGDLRAGRTGSLSIAYFASVGSAWMPTVVSTMMAEFPAVRLDLALREDVPTDPAERPDLQIAVEQGAIHRPGLVAQHLLDDPYVAVLPSGHPLAEREQIDLVDLAGDRWVDNDFARGWCRKNLIEACHAAGFSPPFHVEAHDYPTAMAFVAAGIGLTVLPTLGARQLPRRGGCGARDEPDPGPLDLRPGPRGGGRHPGSADGAAGADPARSAGSRSHSRWCAAEHAVIRTARIWAAVTGGVSVVGVLIQYPFLDVAARGVGPVAITCAAIALLLVGLAWACGRLTGCCGHGPRRTRTVVRAGDDLVTV